MVPIRDRPTPDLVVIFLAGTIGFVVCASLIGLIVVTATQPDIDVSVWVSRITGITNTLTGAVVGYVAGGLRTQAINGNGGKL